jgi:hypothetical protein
MSPSFMFVLQILFVLCLIHRILMLYFFGIVSSDTLVSIIVDNSLSVTPISPEFMKGAEQTAMSRNDEKFNYFLSTFFKFV